MKDASLVKKIAYLLVLVGALNWGFYAADFNLVEKLFGFCSVMEKSVYSLVALSAVYLFISCKKCCKKDK